MSIPTAAAAEAAPAPAPAEVKQTRSWKAPVGFALFTLVEILLLALPVPGDRVTRIDLNDRAVRLELAPLLLPTLLTNLLLGAGLAAMTIVSFLRAARARSVPPWFAPLFGLLWVVALVVFIGAGSNVPLSWLLTGALALSTPLIFGSMAGLVSERAGVVNIAIEGQLLAGAFTSALIASMTGSTVAGLLGGVVAGVLVSLVLAVFSIRYVVEQVVVGVVVNILVIGLTNFLYSSLMSDDPARYNAPPRYPVLPLPGLSEIPVIGPLLFNNTPIVYLMFLLVPTLAFALFRTRWGLRVRAVGEHPKAADTVGIRVNPTRFRNVLLSGAIAGAGGSFFTLGMVGEFTREMTSGAGYIALAALIFGRWHPVYAALAALLFGFASNLKALASQVGANVPAEFMAMIPYLVTILAVAGFVGQSRAPAADGKPYIPS